MDKELSETNFAHEIVLYLGELKNRGFDSRPRLSYFPDFHREHISDDSRKIWEKRPKTPFYVLQITLC